MHSEFEMSMIGELNFFLGLQIKQLKEGTFINQAKYIRDILKRFNMEEAKTMKTPMSSSIKLDKDEKGKSIDSTMYRGMIGSLLYLTAGRTDIMYSPSYTEPSSRPAFTEPTHTEIPPPQAPLAPNHAPWMDLSAQIISLGTGMKELTVVKRIEHIQDRLEHQHEEMMPYPHSMFPPSPPQH
ncbi:hypothetical protein AAG906_018520 [Vitis piasezkii]